VWMWLVARALATRKGIVAAAAFGAWLVVLRPIFLPIVLVVSVLAAVRFRRQALVLVAVALGPVIVLSIANGIVHAKWTMTTVATGNVTGKVFRYGMQGESVPARFRKVRAGALRTRWDGTQASFYRTAPEVTLDEGTAWGLNVARHHSVTYVRHSLREVVDVWLLEPIRYTAWDLGVLARLVQLAVWGAYLLVPVVAVAGFVRRDVLLVMLASIVVVLLLVLAFDEYIDFERVRMPVDAVAVAGMACLFPLRRYPAVRDGSSSTGSSTRG
jgi:hypothetical protein